MNIKNNLKNPNTGWLVIFLFAIFFIYQLFIGDLLKDSPYWAVITAWAIVVGAFGASLYALLTGKQ